MHSASSGWDFAHSWLRAADTQKMRWRGRFARGATQYVILGAGLDTFAYRNPYAESALRVFEVDFPATQEWKRAQSAGSAELRFRRP